MKKTRLGISSYSLTYAVGVPGFEPQMPLDAFGLVDKAVELGVSVLQIADNCPLDKLSAQRLNELAEYGKKHGIEFEVGTRGITNERLKQYIQIAKVLDAHLLRVVIDAPGFEPDIDTIIELIRAILPQLEETGIILGIENHDRFTADIFAHIVKSIDSPYVGIVLDTVNSFSCEENTETVLKHLAKYTVNFHVKDYTIKRIENSMGLIVIGTPAGQGRLNIPEVERRLMSEAMCDYSSILELWMPQAEDIGTTLFNEDHWVRESIVYLKNVITELGS